MTDSTQVKASPALSAAGQLGHDGQAMLGKWRGLRSRIEALNAKQPWGNDEPGKNFNQYYLDGKTGYCTSLLEGGDSMVVALSKLGDQVRDGVQGVVDLDDLTAQWFKK